MNRVGWYLILSSFVAGWATVGLAVARGRIDGVAFILVVASFTINFVTVAVFGRPGKRHG